MTMIDHSDEDSEPGAYASPACFMHEVDPDYFGLASGTASAQRDNIMRWRKNERKRLIAQRLAISNDERSDRAAYRSLLRHAAPRSRRNFRQPLLAVSRRA